MTGDGDCGTNLESKHEEEEDDGDGSSGLLLLEVVVKRVLAREAEQPMTGKKYPKGEKGSV